MRLVRESLHMPRDTLAELVNISTLARDASRLTPERLYVIREGKIVAKTNMETELFL